MLELHRVVKHYHGPDPPVRAVDGVSLVVRPGRLSALYGPSGSGKTTLLLLAAGILAPDDGEVTFGGTDLTTLSRGGADELRLRRIGMIFQSFHLMHGASALDNAALKLLMDGTPRAQARRAAAPWLERLGLSSRAAHLPGQLSTGERQRVAIARALANRPAVILADEPTGSLDSHSGRTVLKTLAAICHEEQVGVLLVTHDPMVLEFADTAHTLRDGKLLADVPDALAGASASTVL